MQLIPSEYAARVMQKHDEQKLFAPENGKPLKFKIGDIVTYTNDYGIRFHGLRVTGIYECPSEPCSHYGRGGRYFLNDGTRFSPKAEDSIEHCITSTN